MTMGNWDLGKCSHGWRDYCITDGALGHTTEDARAAVWRPDLLGGPTLCEKCQDKGFRHEKLKKPHPNASRCSNILPVKFGSKEKRKISQAVKCNASWREMCDWHVKVNDKDLRCSCRNAGVTFWSICVINHQVHQHCSQSCLALWIKTMWHVLFSVFVLFFIPTPSLATCPLAWKGWTHLFVDLRPLNYLMWYIEIWVQIFRQSGYSWP